MTHLGGASFDTPDEHTFMPDVWERLVKDFGFRSVLDLGCGAGWSTAWFVRRGLRALGLEGDPEAIRRRQTDAILSVDFTRGPWYPVNDYDLGWCAEFVEHVEASAIGNWMAALIRCRFVAITFATPGQGGHHHVNEQSEGYWWRTFDAAGFDHRPDVTAWMRATDRGAPWGRRTLTFFERRSAT